MVKERGAKDPDSSITGGSVLRMKELVKGNRRSRVERLVLKENQHLVMVMKRLRIWNVAVIRDTTVIASISNIRSPLLNKTTMEIMITNEVTQLHCFRVFAHVSSLLMCSFLMTVPEKRFCLRTISMNVAVSEKEGRRIVNTILVMFMVIV